MYKNTRCSECVRMPCFFYLIFNLLDQNHKEVRLVINYIAGFVLINVLNNYAQVNREPDGKFISTKKNHLGIGMKNVQRTVEKYDGIYSAEINDDRFIVKITISYVKKERSV